MPVASSSPVVVEPPRGARADATRNAIVTTAERLFRSMGYQKTTVADIARELRMSPANVYRFFPSKTAINEAICTRLLGGLSEHIWSIARGPDLPEDRIRLIFAALHQKSVQLFFDEKRMHDMVNAAMHEHWTIIDGYIHDIDTALRHVIMDGQASGAFAREMDAHATSRLIHATTVHFCHPTLIEQSIDEDLPSMASGMAELVLRALRP